MIVNTLGGDSYIKVSGVLVLPFRDKNVVEPLRVLKMPTASVIGVPPTNKNCLSVSRAFLSHS